MGDSTARSEGQPGDAKRASTSRSHAPVTGEADREGGSPPHDAETSSPDAIAPTDDGHGEIGNSRSADHEEGGDDLMTRMVRGPTWEGSADRAIARARAMRWLGGALAFGSAAYALVLAGQDVVADETARYLIAGLATAGALFFYISLLRRFQLPVRASRPARSNELAPVCAPPSRI